MPPLLVMLSVAPASAPQAAEALSEAAYGLALDVVPPAGAPPKAELPWVTVRPLPPASLPEIEPAEASPSFLMRSAIVTDSPGSRAPSRSAPDPASLSAVWSFENCGPGAAGPALDTTRAKSWSVVSVLPGTPSLAMLVAPTLTESRPLVPAGSTTVSTLLRVSGEPPVRDVPAAMTLPR